MGENVKEGEEGAEVSKDEMTKRIKKQRALYTSAEVVRNAFARSSEALRPLG